MAPAVSAIVVNFRRPELLAACLGSLEEALGQVAEETELVVVDNGSGDGSVEVVRERFPGAVLIALPENLGFSGGVQEGLDRAGGEWALLLNNDATIARDAVGELLAAGRSAPDVGSVAAQMRFAGSEPPVINSAGIGVDRLGVAYDRLLGAPAAEAPGRPVEVFGASGGAALLRRAMLDEIGGFDRSFFAFLEDVDLAWRARMRGWRALYAPAAVVQHHHSATAGHGSALKHRLVGRNRVRLLAKNADASHLRRYGVAMVAYDLGYVTFAVLGDRTLAPLTGRLAGLREWRTYRRRGAAGRRPVELEPVRGLRAALRRRRAWRGRSAGADITRDAAGRRAG